MPRIDRDKRILLKIADGPEGIEIYTSDQEGVTDWANDLPALYLVADVDGASVKLGPFQLSSIREYFEYVAETLEAMKLITKAKAIQAQAAEDGIEL